MDELGSSCWRRKAASYWSLTAQTSMPPKVVIEYEGERKEGVVVSQWVDATTHARYIVLRLPMDPDDPDELTEMQDALEDEEEASAPSKRVPPSAPKPSRSTRSR